jgi:hypothetical protein
LVQLYIEPGLLSNKNIGPTRHKKREPKAAVDKKKWGQTESTDIQFCFCFFVTKEKLEPETSSSGRGIVGESCEHLSYNKGKHLRNTQAHVMQDSHTHVSSKRRNPHRIPVNMKALNCLSKVEEFGYIDNTITLSKECSRKHIPYNYERISH